MKTSFALLAVLFSRLESLVMIDCGGNAVSDGSAGSAGEATNAGAGPRGSTNAGASSVGGAASGSAGNMDGQRQRSTNVTSCPS